MARTLEKIAAEIHEIVGDMKGAGAALLSCRLCMGQLLAEAKKMFKTKKEFFDWCAKNVFRSNGKPYATATIDNYIMFATVPGRYERERAYHARYQAKERSTVQEHRYDSAPDTSRYQSLLSMWRACSGDDRDKFLKYLWKAFPENIKAAAA